jgi:endoglucanase
MASRRRLLRLGGLAVAAATIVATAIVGITLNATPAAAAGGTGVGYLHTNGSKIVDSTGATVRLTGLNWFGMETSNLTFHGLWAGKPATWTEQLQHMAQLGFNTIRVPFTGQALAPGAVAQSINTDTNPDLVGNTPMQILDKVVAYAGSLGMRIILDRHRPDTSGQTALWYTSSVSEASEIADWQMLAQHFANNPTVIGADLFNEPHADGTDPQGIGACWGCGDTTKDWRLAAERIGNAILATNPNWLIFVEGVSCDLPSGGTPNQWNGTPVNPLSCDWWGGNLSLAGTDPVVLNVANRLVYSAHDYGLSVYPTGQPWFHDSTFPANLPSVWDHFWGYLVKQNIAPVYIGEFGSTLAQAQDTQWMTALMSYMGSGINGMSFTYWSWNPDSGDTGGIVGNDWLTVDPAKMAIVGPYLIAPVSNGTPPPPPPTTTSVNPPPTTTAPPPTTTAPPPTTTAPPPTTTPPPPGGKCSASYAIVNSYQGGFQTTVTVTAGSAAITSWTVKWSFANGQTITQLWNGNLTTSGSNITVTNMSYNGSIAAGGNTTFGFNGTWNNTTNAIPTLTCS